PGPGCWPDRATAESANLDEQSSRKVLLERWHHASLVRYLDAERLDLTVDLDRRELAHALSRRLDGEVRADAYTRHLYSRDASMYAIEPFAVAFPRHAQDVVSAVEVAREYR